MRLIDADALIHEIQSVHCNDCDRRKGTKKGKTTFVYEIGDAPCRACGIGDALDYLEDAPTVDAVPVEWFEGVIRNLRAKGRKEYADAMQIILDVWNDAR